MPFVPENLPFRDDPTSEEKGQNHNSQKGEDKNGTLEAGEKTMLVPLKKRGSGRRPDLIPTYKGEKILKENV